MKEKLISFETAKLAKEKRFNIPVRNYFCNVLDIKKSIRESGFSLGKYDGTEHYNGIDYFEETCIVADHNNERAWTGKDLKRISQPTQSLLQKWLREVHNVVIEEELIPGFSYPEFIFSVYIKNNIYILKTFEMKRYKIYENALEKGLQKALKLLP